MYYSDRRFVVAVGRPAAEPKEDPEGTYLGEGEVEVDESVFHEETDDNFFDDEDFTVVELKFD